MCYPLSFGSRWAVQYKSPAAGMWKDHTEKREAPDKQRKGKLCRVHTRGGGTARARSWQEGGEQQVKQKPAY